MVPSPTSTIWLRPSAEALIAKGRKRKLVVGDNPISAYKNTRRKLLLTPF
jgi:hypothetical protein